MAHREQKDGEQAHSYLDLGAALYTLLKGACHLLLWVLSLGQVTARLGRWVRVAVGVGGSVDCESPGSVSQWLWWC
jgi:hypothetical protein